MKKIVVSLLLCGCVILSITGCSKKEPSTDTKLEYETPSDTDNGNTEETEEVLSEPDISETALKQEALQNSKYDLETSNWNYVFYQLNTVNFKVPFSYARISKDWTFNLADYGHDETFRLQPGERTTATVELRNPIYDYPMIVGFYNPYDVPITIEESYVWSVSFSFKDSQSDIFPILPKNLTKGSTVADVILTYGDPTVPYTHDSETGDFTFTYHLNYDKYVILTINDAKGLVGLTVQHYSFEE